MTLNLPEKIASVHESLHAADIPHAFGGALALAWCTGRARATIAIDINVFVEIATCEAVFAAMPEGVQVTKNDLKIAKRDGQVRIWWDKTPVDVFLNTHAFHVEAASRTRWESFMNKRLPFISCFDLAVFKVFFNRTKDWADLEEMFAASTLDIPRINAQIIQMLGADDERVQRLAALADN